MHPHIICHMMTTVDGKIAETRWTQPFNGMNIDDMTSSYYDISDAFETDAEMLGRKTVQIHYMPDVFDATGLAATQNLNNFIGKRQTEKLFIVIDPRGRIRYSDDKICGKNIITVIGEMVCDTYLAHLREFGISYVFAGADGKDLAKAMDSLAHDFKLRSIVLQGGGILNGAFLKARLINELSLIIYPGIDGLSGASTLFDWVGARDELPANGQTLELTSMKDIGNGMIWLRYNFHTPD